LQASQDIMYNSVGLAQASRHNV